MIVTKVDNKEICFPQLRGSMSALKFPCMAEVKIDGEFNYLHITNGDAFTINKYGTMRRDFKALNDILSKGIMCNSCTLVVEVYWHDGKLGALYDLLSHKKDNDSKLAIFDIIEMDGKVIKDLPYVERKEILYEIGVGFYLPKCWVAINKEEANMHFKRAVHEGYEGIVLKNLDSKFTAGPCDWVKLKYKDQNDLIVSSIDQTKERIEVKRQLPDCSYIAIGVKAPSRYKKHISLGDIVTIEHQGVLSSGSLRHPVLIPKKGW